MKDSSIMISKTVKDINSILMRHFIKDSLKMEWKMVRASINGQMDKSMTASGKIIWNTEVVSGKGMDHHILANGITEQFLASEFLQMTKAKGIKDNF